MKYSRSKRASLFRLNRAGVSLISEDETVGLSNLGGDIKWS